MRYTPLLSTDTTMVAALIAMVAGWLLITLPLWALGVMHGGGNAVLDERRR